MLNKSPLARMPSQWLSWLASLLGCPSPEWSANASRWMSLPLPDAHPITIWSADVYADPLKGLIRRAKYGHDWTSAKLVARGCSKITGSSLWARRPILVPIPADPARLGPRGFHLPLLIALEIGRARACPVMRQGLTKRTTSPVQAGLTRSERLAGLEGQFLASPRLAGRAVLLVDDVLTTGATLAVARKALEAVGAEVLGGLVAARVPAHQRAPMGGPSGPTLAQWPSKQRRHPHIIPKPRPRPPA